MASGSSLTVSFVEEKLKSGKPVYFLNFRFSVGKKGNLQSIHTKITERGWIKLPDLESTFVWFGRSDPPEVTDILRKACFDNHICRFLMGSLTDAGLLEGMGTAPALASNKSSGQTTLHDYIQSNVNDGGQGVKILPELEQVKPIVISDSEEEGCD